MATGRLLEICFPLRVVLGSPYAKPLSLGDVELTYWAMRSRGSFSFVPWTSFPIASVRSLRAALQSSSGPSNLEKGPVISYGFSARIPLAKEMTKAWAYDRACLRTCY